MSEIPDVIQAKEFQLVDGSGNVTATLRPNELSGKPAFALRDQEGNARLGLALDENDQPFLFLANESNEIRLIARLNETGEPVFSLFDGQWDKTEMAGSGHKLPYYRPVKVSSDGEKARVSGEEAPRRRWWQL